MKILHIISGDIFAGAEMQVLQTLHALKSRNVQCHCILFNNGILEQKLRTAGVSTYVINENLLNIFHMICKTALLYKQIRPDLVHVHRAKEHFLGFLSQLFTLKFKPLFRTVHGLNHKPMQKKWITQFKWYLTTFTDRFLLRFLSYSTIAVSNDMLSYLRAFRSSSGILKLCNAINPADYSHISSETVLDIRKKYLISDDFWIGSAARLAAPKNQIVFIDAARIISNAIPQTFKFSIFGDGPLRDELQKRIDNSKLSDCFFLHGFALDIIPVIASFDLFILCSFHEGLPMALLEAMALGKPVICTAVGGIKEVISNYYNGVLVPSNDPSYLADAIKLLYHNHRLRQTISDNARKHICQNYSIEKATDNLLNYYLHSIRRNRIYGCQ
jgi:glycosyltransferase involved in cell wall biosynthesis